MLRRMFALMALVSLLALAACNSGVTGVDVDTSAERDSDRHTDEIAPEAPDELVDPDEGGGGGGGDSEEPPTADENRRRRHRDDIAP